MWVNGHHLEELPYHVSVDLLRDSNTDVLSFVVIRQQYDHQLLQQRQSDQQRFVKFLNEQSPEEYYEDMYQQQLKHQRRQETAIAAGNVSEVLLRDAVPTRLSATADRYSSLPLCRECNLRKYRDLSFIPGAIACSQCDSLRVRLKVEYSGPSTVITIPVKVEPKQLQITPPVNSGQRMERILSPVNKTLVSQIQQATPEMTGVTRTKMELSINRGDDVVTKYTTSKVIKLKRSESRGEMSSSSRAGLFIFSML